VTAAAPRVSVVVAAHRSHETIGACLTALRAQRFRDFEVVVVDSSPDARTRELVAGSFPEVRLVASAERLLPHEARNRGVREAKGAILVFTDADCRGEPNWLERLVTALDAGHPVVCGAIELDGAGWFALGVHLCKYSFRLQALPAGPCAIAGTANAAYAREAFERAGPFDGARFAGDALLSWRAARLGLVPWFEPRAVVHHRFEHSLPAFVRERLERGRDFGDARVAFEAWPRARLAAALAALPALPLVPLARGARDAVRSGRLAGFVATLPLQVLGHAAWSLGEARAQAERLRGGDGLG
jgi:glycosyltransferase involved in cell wall biosynthesis